MELNSTPPIRNPAAVPEKTPINVMLIALARNACGKISPMIAELEGIKAANPNPRRNWKVINSPAVLLNPEIKVAMEISTMPLVIIPFLPYLSEI